MVREGYIPDELAEPYELRMIGVVYTLADYLDMPAMFADDLMLLAQGLADRK